MPQNKTAPNLIFLMSDQQRWDALGVTNPRVKTPNLDKLAARGILFSQAVCQAPLCIPSRNSLMLGLYPWQVGVRANSIGITDDACLPARPLAQRLREAGYQTAGFGKTHWSHRGKEAPPTTRGFEVRAIAQKSDGPLYEHGATMMGDADPVALGNYLAETGDYGPGEQGLKGYLGCTSSLPPEQHRDGWVTARCLEFLDAGYDPSRPLFLYLSFLRPHAGLNVPRGYEELYDIDEIPDLPQPPWREEPPGHAAPQHETTLMRYLRGELYPAWEKMSPLERRRTTLRYWATCTWLDEMYGRVLARLESLGILDHSLILFVSDHGDMLGERNFRFAKSNLYDPTVRVPLILSGSCVPPPLRGAIDDRPSELVDIVPTLLARAGIADDPTLPGHDLLGPSRRRGAFCEFHGNGDELTQPAPCVMWRTKKWKLILYLGGDAHDAIERVDATQGELYDLENDPREWVNLYDDASLAAIREGLKTQLLMHLVSVSARHPWHRELDPLRPPPPGAGGEYRPPDSVGNPT